MSRGAMVPNDLAVAEAETKNIDAAQYEVQGTETRNRNPEFRLGVVTASSQVTDGSTLYFQWLYTVSWVLKVETGYGLIADGVWEVYGSSQTDVININESINQKVADDDSGSFGNGVDIDDLEAVGNFELGPVPNGTPVLCFRLGDTVADTSGSSIEHVTEWGFSIPNGVTGGCV